MYRLAADHASERPDNAWVFLESCSATPAGDDNLSLAHSAAALMRRALDSGELGPLNDLIGNSLGLGYDLADVLAAAGQLVIDALGDLPFALLETWVRRIAELQRTVFPLDAFTGFPAEGLGSRAFAR